jgi:Uma2 family endonuclease
MQTTPSPESQARPLRRATVEDWLAIPEARRAELIDGRIVYHAQPTLKHGAAQGEVFSLLRPFRRGKQGPGSPPGGWWMSQDVDLVLGDLGCRPDVAGWRRDRHARVPEANEQGVITAVPDFVCEVISPSTARYDQGAKRDGYFVAGVSHYWLVDPAYQTLTVLERGERGYVILHVAGPGDMVRAPPFEEVEIAVGELFLDGEEASSSAPEPR